MRGGEKYKAQIFHRYYILSTGRNRPGYSHTSGLMQYHINSQPSIRVHNHGGLSDPKWYQKNAMVNVCLF